MKKQVFVIVLLVMAANLTGCHALREKFVRKNKKDIPPPLYLDLKEYPKVPTKDMYNEYYLFVRGWLQELKIAIKDNISHKRQKKSIDEALKNLEQIMYYYTEEGKKQIQPIYERFVAVQDKIHDPYFPTLGNYSMILRQIERIQRDFEKKFTFDKALQWMQEG